MFKNQFVGFHHFRLRANFSPARPKIHLRCNVKHLFLPIWRFLHTTCHSTLPDGNKKRHYVKLLTTHNLKKCKYVYGRVVNITYCHRRLLRIHLAGTHTKEYKKRFTPEVSVKSLKKGATALKKAV